MDYAVLEFEPHMSDVIEQLIPPGISCVDMGYEHLDDNQTTIQGPTDLIPATVVRLHTTLSKPGKRRCKLVPA